MRRSNGTSITSRAKLLLARACFRKLSRAWSVTKLGSRVRLLLQCPPSHPNAYGTRHPFYSSRTIRTHLLECCNETATRYLCLRCCLQVYSGRAHTAQQRWLCYCSRKYGRRIFWFGAPKLSWCRRKSEDLISCQGWTNLPICIWLCP